MKDHRYAIQIEWTGNVGEGTTTYNGYRRNHIITSSAKPEIQGSSDPSFRGDRTRYNPEELLVASLSSCHMLSYLHLCSVNGVVVVGYKDEASGLMAEDNNGSGKFVEVRLEPRVTISASSDRAKALALHSEAHHVCFIANSVNFPVEVTPDVSHAPA